GDLVAAADVAARLGFETSAIDLPLARTAASDLPTVFVGSKSLAGSGVTPEFLGATGLKAGGGLIAALSPSGGPSIAVLGGDDSGIGAAAVMPAGHLPYVWDQKGPTTDKIADEVRDFLKSKGIAATAAVTSAAYVKANADGADRLVVDLQLPGG